MIRFRFPLRGGCYCKSGFIGSDVIHNFKFTWKTVKTTDGDCILANLIKSSGFKG